MHPFFKFFWFAAVTLYAMVAAQAQDFQGFRALLEKKWPDNRAVRVVFHGHSVPAGYQVTPEVRTFEAYPHGFHVWLKQHHPFAVVNVIVTAIGGEDSISGAARFEHDVLPLKPDLLCIDYALNDRRLPLDAVEAAWTRMIQMAKSQQIPLVLLTPTGDATADLSSPDDPLRQRADLIRKLAAVHQVALADVSAAWLSELSRGTSQDALLSQHNHPSFRGHQLVVNALIHAVFPETISSSEISP